MKKRHKSLLPKLLCIPLVAAIICASLYVAQILIVEPSQTQKSFEDLKTTVKKPENLDVPAAELRDTRTSAADIRKMQEKYPDVAAWLQIPDTKVDYPVVHPRPNKPEFYLRRDLEGNYSTAGCLFLDAACSLQDDIQIVYGHNMTNGTMFQFLTKYLVPEVVTANPVIYFDTDKGRSEYVVFSVFKTNVDAGLDDYFPYVRYHFDEPDDKIQYLYDVMSRSMITTSYKLNEDDSLLVLSTCDYDYDDCRLVVVARKLREGENVKRMEASKNESPLQSSAWYSAYGGEKPDIPKDYHDAVEKGLMEWYDGSLSSADKK